MDDERKTGLTKVVLPGGRTLTHIRHVGKGEITAGEFLALTLNVLQGRAKRIQQALKTADKKDER